MYDLQLTSDEIYTIRHVFEKLRVGHKIGPFTEDPCVPEILMKITIALCNAQEQDEAEVLAGRYARNAHSQPEGL